MSIAMKSVSSSSISSIGYRRRLMKVEFNSGRTYEFKSVPRSVFDQFIQSNSKGEFFNKNIRGTFVEKEVS